MKIEKNCLIVFLIWHPHKDMPHQLEGLKKIIISSLSVIEEKIIKSNIVPIEQRKRKTTSRLSNCPCETLLIRPIVRNRTQQVHLCTLTGCICLIRRTTFVYYNDFHRMLLFIDVIPTTICNFYIYS